MDYQVYCAICGGPFGTLGRCRNDLDDIEWLIDTVMLTSAHETKNGLELDRYALRRLVPTLSWDYLDLDESQSEEDQIILRLDACPKEPESSFELLETGEEVKAYLHGHHGSHDKTFPRLFIPVHRNCLEVADHFMEWVSNHATKSPPRSIIAMKDLWKILHLRLDSNTQRCPNEPHKYFGGWHCRCGRAWDVDDIGQEEGITMEKDPISIPNLTEMILHILRPLPAELAKPSSWDTSILNGDDDGHNDDDLRASQSTSDGGAVGLLSIPWLWDLDKTLVYAKQAEGDWDWGHLVREVIQTSSKLEDETVKLPRGLRNRCRIWRLLREARIDDVNEQRRARAAAIVRERAEKIAADEASGRPFLVPVWPLGREPPGFGFPPLLPLGNRPIIFVPAPSRVPHLQ